VLLSVAGATVSPGRLRVRCCHSQQLVARPPWTEEDGAHLDSPLLARSPLSASRNPHYRSQVIRERQWPSEDTLVFAVVANDALWV
jgi:hypothetical protein